MIESTAASFMPVFPAAQAIKLAQRISWISPQGFGARGDGIADDTTAVQDAINSVGEVGEVFFPPGTYKVTTLTIPSGTNVSLVGSGMGSTIIKKSTSTASTAAITISVGANNCSVRDLTIQGSSVASYVQDEHGIAIVGTDNTHRVSDIVIENVEVYDIGSNAIFCNFGHNVNVSKCKLHDCGYIGIGFWSTDYASAVDNEVYTMTPGTAGNAYGIVFSHIDAGYTQGKYAKAVRNYVHDIDLWEGIDTHGYTHLTITDNTIFQCRRGVVAGIHVASSFVPSYCVISNNTLDAGALGTILEGIILAGIDGGADAIGCVISNNTIKGYRAFTTDWGAITTYATTGLVISGNSLYNSIGCGINLYKENTDVIVTGNSIAGIVTGLGNASGFSSRALLNTGLVIGNIIDATAEFGVYAPFDSTALRFGNNTIITSNLAYSHPANLGQGREIYGSGTVDPGNVADGAALAPITITVTGSQLGDAVEFSAPYDLQGLTVTAYVSAVNTIAFEIWNKTGGAVDLASGTWKVRVTKL